MSRSSNLGECEETRVGRDGPFEQLRLRHHQRDVLLKAPFRKY